MPELFEKMESRYSILKTISRFEPLGRRTLALNVGKTERHIRSEVEFLEANGLIQVTNKGMFVSTEGKELVDEYHHMIRAVSDVEFLEAELQKILPVKQIKIVPGNADESEDVKHSLGKEAANLLMEQMQRLNVVTVTGGSTMAAVANRLKPQENSKPLFVPARGGLGDQHEYQANSICVKMAEKTNGSYRLLYVPDSMGEALHEQMQKEPTVTEVIEWIGKANIVIHGVGDAMTMAERRRASDRTKQQITKEKAVGESFGYYFDQNGKTVHRVNSIGMTKEQLDSMQQVITVAGGASKSEAISAYFKWGHSDVLVIDEAIARHLLSNKE